MVVKPSEWLRSKQSQELIDEIARAGIPALEQNQALKVLNGGSQAICLVEPLKSEKLEPFREIPERNKNNRLWFINEVKIPGIPGIGIRTDEQGRYCLNDLHRAAGGEKRHQPSNWLQLDQTKALIAEVDKAVPVITGTKQNQSLKVVHGGNRQGVYAVKKLVYAKATVESQQ